MSNRQGQPMHTTPGGKSPNESMPSYRYQSSQSGFGCVSSKSVRQEGDTEALRDIGRALNLG
jgi:hypothetical protein